MLLGELYVNVVMFSCNVSLYGPVSLHQTSRDSFEGNISYIQCGLAKYLYW